MRLLINDRKFHYEMEKLVRIFFPNEKIEVVIGEDSADYNILTKVGDKITVSVCFGDFFKTANSPVCENNELQTAKMLYALLSEYTSFYPKWGVLTGVRPSKLLITLENEMGREKTEKYFVNELLVSEEKLKLAQSVADSEEKIISLSKPDSFSLYISIPFCPTRCSYCSFVSHAVESKTAQKLLPQYAELLLEELKITGEIARNTGLRLESVYIGGGTPTTLSENQLYNLIKSVESNFDLSVCREFTVEAGRPDTITEEKLRVLKDSSVTRISINPQTFSDSVLNAVGRKHTAEDTVNKFNSARKIGIDNINMDLIAGLPTDTLEGFCSSLDTAYSLDPENITVHTLALKRSSNMSINNINSIVENATSVSEMIDYTYRKLSEKYRPYYMYRQSKSAGSLENTGWCKENRECLYNIFMMEECHTILACGGGAVTKLKEPNGNEIERIFNYKYPYEYISGFETLMSRKKRITEFYDTYPY